MGGVCSKRDGEDFTESVEKGLNAKKKALLVGINYKGTSNELGGCINDAKSQKKVLMEIFGFSEKNIEMLIDEPGYTSPTCQNIKNGLIRLLDSKAGDTVFFAYSGHGSQMPCYDGTEADGKNEILCPLDLTENWNKNAITDDLLHSVFYDKMPDGVLVVNIFDCCHSATLTDLPCMKDLDAIKPRYWEPPADVKKEIEACKPNETKGFHAKTKAAIKLKVNSLSGCKDNQTSADATIGGKRQGALTWALLESLQEGCPGDQYSGKYVARYDRLLTKVRSKLAQKGFSQIPVLSTSEEKYMRGYYLGKTN